MTETNGQQAPGPSPPPRAALDFVAAAERAFNTKNVELTAAPYADDGVVELVTDGVRDRFVGKDEIRRGWQAIFRAMPTFRLKKELTLADRFTIVNEWAGSIQGREERFAVGFEVWRFNDAGLVTQHRLFTFLRVHDADTLSAKFRFGVVNPVVGARLEKERRRIRKGL